MKSKLEKMGFEFKEEFSYYTVKTEKEKKMASIFNVYALDMGGEYESKKFMIVNLNTEVTAGILEYNEGGTALYGMYYLGKHSDKDKIDCIKMLIKEGEI